MGRFCPYDVEVPVDGDLFFVATGTLLYYSKCRKEKVNMRKIKVDTHVARIYVGCHSEFRVIQTQMTRAYPGISSDEGMTKLYKDRPGSRKEFEKLLAEAKKGDHVVIPSVFTLADGGDEKTMIKRLRKLNSLGLYIHVAFEDDFSFASYDEMYKMQHRLQEQRKIFEELCVDTDGRYRMWDYPDE
ncbi:MAG: hypothetical protein E7440_01820 [Ruminococcaceae bacterium]|nr:hypothetical protein [Oscillospiraceae bacterium]